MVIVTGFRLGESDEAIQIQVTEKAMFLGRTTYFDLLMDGGFFMTIVYWRVGLEMI